MRENPTPVAVEGSQGGLENEGEDDGVSHHQAMSLSRLVGCDGPNRPGPHSGLSTPITPQGYWICC